MYNTFKLNYQSVNFFRFNYFTDIFHFHRYTIALKFQSFRAKLNYIRIQVYDKLHSFDSNKVLHLLINERITHDDYILFDNISYPLVTIIARSEKN